MNKIQTGRSTVKTSAVLEEGQSANQARPIVKWAGGKRWLAVHVNKITPDGWEGRYYEPFFGGGALFFALQPKQATISDANSELIATYRAIRNQPDEVIRLLQSYPFGKRFFYNLREQRPRADLTIAARLLYLNKTCWNGLYRVTNDGRFNTPFGRYEKPSTAKDLVDPPFKHDLHSFRGARNLVDHKVVTRREDKRRELQFAERMMQGPRLVAELLSLKRKIR